VINVKL